MPNGYQLSGGGGGGGAVYWYVHICMSSVECVALPIRDMILAASSTFSCNEKTLLM